MSAPYGPPGHVGYPPQPAPARTGRTVLRALLSALAAVFLLIAGYLVVINLGVIDTYTTLPALPGKLISQAEVAAVLPGAGPLACDDSTGLIRTLDRDCKATGPAGTSLTISERLFSGTILAGSVRASNSFGQRLAGSYPIHDLDSWVDAAYAFRRPPLSNSVYFRRGNIVVGVDVDLGYGGGNQVSEPPVPLARSIAQRMAP
ncbi:hypothetical protein GCM10009765_09130 [Fodinicola feengrottensis]|uniref:Uncharacterized protein n=1 Tax=Fodinicola feengrottensis TaxID=435914 RepID=A0ABP4S0T0_9ACTN